jgi:hypothetical protein
MRYLCMSLVIAGAFAMTACASKSSSNSNSSDQSSAAASSAAGAPSAAASAAAGQVPSYPGAVTEASGSSSNMGQSAAGTVMTTDDPFDKVYTWYQQNMPAGSEKSHTTAPMNSAVFMMGDTGDQTSVTITTQGSKTMITIGHVKQ